MYTSTALRPYTSSAVRRHHVSSNATVTGKDVRNSVRNDDLEELASLLDAKGKDSEIMDDTDNMGRSALWLAAFKGRKTLYIFLEIFVNSS